jgi:hypothetical protein
MEIEGLLPRSQETATRSYNMKKMNPVNITYIF